MSFSVLATTNAAGISRQVRRDATRHPQILARALSRLAYHGQQDAKASMKRELDRPTPFTQKALLYEKARVNKMESAVYVNPRNTYLQYMVFGGIRQQRGRILVPNAKLRTDRYGNLGRAKRRRIIASNKTFKINKGGRQRLMRRIGKRVEFVASLERRVAYRSTGYWQFHDSGLRTYQRRFNRLFIQEHMKVIRR